MHLTPIAPTEPNAFFNNTINVEGPNGLFLFGEVVNTFSATTVPTTVPEGDSSALLLTSGLVALGSLRRRI
jgi:MYXO-CTERM domain-containing protein